MTDAVKDLRAWQREQATSQERALRNARRLHRTIGDLDAKRDETIGAFSAAVVALESSGIDRDHVAALLDLSPPELARLTRSRRSATATEPASRSNG